MGDCILRLLFVSTVQDLHERRQSLWGDRIEKRRNEVSNLLLSHKSVISIDLNYKAIKFIISSIMDLEEEI